MQIYWLTCTCAPAQALLQGALTRAQPLRVQITMQAGWAPVITTATVFTQRTHTGKHWLPPALLFHHTEWWWLYHKASLAQQEVSGWWGWNPISRNVTSVSGGYDWMGRFMDGHGTQTATSRLLVPTEPLVTMEPHKSLRSSLRHGKGADGLVGHLLLSCPFSSPDPNPGITHIPTVLCKQQKNLHVKDTWSKYLAHENPFIPSHG